MTRAHRLGNADRQWLPPGTVMRPLPASARPPIHDFDVRVGNTLRDQEAQK